MPIILIQDFSGAGFSGGLESDNNALQRVTHKRTSITQRRYLKWTSTWTFCYYDEKYYKIPCGSSKTTKAQLFTGNWKNIYHAVPENAELTKLCFKISTLTHTIYTLNVRVCCAHLPSLQLFLGQLHQGADLGGDTEIFEEALVRRPELTPERLPADQAQLIGCLHERFQRLGPLETDSRCELSV